MRNIPLERDKLEWEECNKENSLEGQNMQMCRPTWNYAESRD